MNARDPLTPEPKAPPSPQIDRKRWASEIAQKPPYLKDAPPRPGPLPKEMPR